MSEPENVTLILFREMRAEMKAGFDAVDRRLETLEARIDGGNAACAKALNSFTDLTAS